MRFMRFNSFFIKTRIEFPSDKDIIVNSLFMITSYIEYLIRKDDGLGTFTRLDLVLRASMMELFVISIPCGQVCMGYSEGTRVCRSFQVSAGSLPGWQNSVGTIHPLRTQCTVSDVSGNVCTACSKSSFHCLS